MSGGVRHNYLAHGRCSVVNPKSQIVNWHHGPIDWDEFWQVVKGNGPCNAERLGARQQAHDDGAWVREALDAYSAKKYGNPQYATA